jgi:hypothetical protein
MHRTATARPEDIANCERRLEAGSARSAAKPAIDPGERFDSIMRYWARLVTERREGRFAGTRPALRESFFALRLCGTSSIKLWGVGASV